MNYSFKTQKLERMRELLVISMWFELPTYLVGLDPKNFKLPDSLKKITSLILKPLQTQ